MSCCLKQDLPEEVRINIRYRIKCLCCFTSSDKTDNKPQNNTSILKKEYINRLTRIKFSCLKKSYNSNK